MFHPKEELFPTHVSRCHPCSWTPLQCELQLHVCKMMQIAAAIIHNLQGSSPMKLRFSKSRASVEPTLLHGITFSAPAQSTSEMINRIIKIANSITYITCLQEVRTRQKYYRWGIFQVRAFPFCGFDTTLQAILMCPFINSVTLRKTEMYIEVFLLNYGKKR